MACVNIVLWFVKTVPIAYQLSKQSVSISQSVMFQFLDSYQSLIEGEYSFTICLSRMFVFAQYLLHSWIDFHNIWY